MRTVGIFEAKTRFTALCEEVIRSGEPTLVSKRGRPLVMVTPVPEETGPAREDILAAWTRWEETRADDLDEADFPEVGQLRGEPKPDPLAEG